MMKCCLITFCFLRAFIFAEEARTCSSFQFSREQVEDYHTKTTSQQERTAKIVESEFFADAKTVLDIGCGDGRITAFLAEKLPNSSIIGCDVSKSMIEFALEKFTSSEYPNLSFIEKDATNLGFNDKFDRIISFNCLHWINNQQKVLDEISASLKSGGKALIISSPKTDKDDLQSVCAKVMISSKWSSYFKNYPQIHSFHTEEDYQKMLKKTDLSIAKIQQTVIDMPFVDRPSLENFLNAVMTPVHHLPENKRRDFLEDVFMLLQERGRVDEKGKIHLHIAQLELLLTKSTLH